MEQVTLHNNFTAFWNKKIKVTYILSVLVCILHVYAYKNYTFGDDLISKINSVFVFALRDVLPPVAVPLFFIISGYAFFRNFTIKKYPQKLKSRIRTLLIPYLIWNTIWMLFQFAVSYSPVSQYFVGRGKLELNVLNVFLSIFHWKANGPFWFVFNLMVFMIASPLIYYLMKNRYVGIISIIALIILLQFDFGIPESIFLEKDSIIYFMFGAMLGIHFKKQFSEHSKKTEMVIYTVLFVVSCGLTVVYKADMLLYGKGVYALVRLFFAFTFWKMYDWYYKGQSVHPYEKRSFMVFAMHLNIVAVISKLIYLLLPKNNIFVIPNTIVTIVLTLVIINWFCVFMERFFPKIYSVISGSRSG